jgi:hypothetical protein
MSQLLMDTSIGYAQNHISFHVHVYLGMLVLANGPLALTYGFLF